jgi:hypothetical protein
MQRDSCSCGRLWRMNWHAFFWHGEISQWCCSSSVFTRLVKGQASAVNYVINDLTFTKGYYLANDIYPLLSTWGQSMTRTWRTKLVFPSAGVLSKEYWASIWCVQTEFCYCPVTCSPMVDDSDVGDHECLYHHVQHMYNIIIESEHAIHSIWLGGPSRPSWSPCDFEIFLQWHHEIRDEHVHQQLRDDLVTHLWERGEETLHEFWSLQTF